MIDPLDYLDLVRNIAKYHAGHLPYSAILEYDDLVSIGTIGLLQAIKVYDKAKNVPFTTFAWYRINGAIRDDMRKVDYLSRKDRKDGKTFEHVPIEDNLYSEPASQEDVLLLKEVLSIILKSKIIHTRERLTLLLHYTEGRTFKEVGKILGVGESMAHHNHTKAINKLGLKAYVKSASA